MANKSNNIFKIIAIIFCIFFGLSIVMLIVSQCVNYEIALPILTVAEICIGIGAGGLFLELIAFIIYCNVSPTMAAERKKDEGEREARLKKLQEREEWKLYNITKTAIIHTATKKDNNDTLKRGVVGGWLFGTTGAIVGTATGKETEYTTFLIIYSDDSRETKEVENGSALYNHYIQYLEV